MSFTGSIDYDVLKVTALSSGSVQIGSLISGPGVPSGTQITGQITGTPNGVGIYSLFISEGTIASEPMKETYGVLTVGYTSSGKVKIGQQVAGLLPDTAIETSLNGSGPGTSWVINNAQTVTSQSLTMTGAPLTVTYNSVTGATKNSGFFKIQQNDDFNYQSSSLTYATGTAARSLGLTKASGAFDSTPGLIVTPKSDRECPTGRYTKTCVSVAAFMNDFTETESDEWSSFQMAYDPTAPTTPGEQAALAAWASDGNSCFLEKLSATTPPIVDSPTCTAQLFARPGPAVPEPSTWAMILLGFAALGFLGYRRRCAWPDPSIRRAACASTLWGRRIFPALRAGGGRGKRSATFRAFRRIGRGGVEQNVIPRIWRRMVWAADRILNENSRIGCKDSRKGCKRDSFEWPYFLGVSKDPQERT